MSGQYDFDLRGFIASLACVALIVGAFIGWLIPKGFAWLAHHVSIH